MMPDDVSFKPDLCRPTLFYSPKRGRLNNTYNIIICRFLKIFNDLIFRGKSVKFYLLKRRSNLKCHKPL